jgi:hypothetical protein
MLTEVLLQAPLGPLVDRKGDVAAGPGGGVRAAGAASELRQDLAAKSPAEPDHERAQGVLARGC